jgi:hypothetical protein
MKFKISQFKWVPEHKQFIATRKELGKPFVNSKMLIYNEKTKGSREFFLTNTDKEDKKILSWKFESSDGLVAIIVNT